MDGQEATIVVVGAGVIGLTTAFEILRKGQTKVAIISEEFHNDLDSSTNYTSTRAGAHYRPFPSVTPADLRELHYKHRTQARFRELALKEPHCSIEFMPGIEYFSEPSEKVLNLDKGYTEETSKFEVLKQDQLPPGIKFGTRYETWCVNPVLYLDFLVRKLTLLGVVLHRKKLDSLKQVYDIIPNVKKIVNCTGKGLQYNGGYDKKSFGIRGQTLLVKSSCLLYNHLTITYQLPNQIWCFVIPRPLGGGLIIGGTKTDQTSKEPIALETEELLANGKKYFPEIFAEDFEIVKINVGFRPARVGGSLVGEDADHPDVLNAYGAAGMGYELSFGIAEQIASLVSGPLAKL